MLRVFKPPLLWACDYEKTEDYLWDLSGSDGSGGGSGSDICKTGRDFGSGGGVSDFDGPDGVWVWGVDLGGNFEKQAGGARRMRQNLKNRSDGSL